MKGVYYTVVTYLVCRGNSSTSKVWTNLLDNSCQRSVCEVLWILFLLDQMPPSNSSHKIGSSEWNRLHPEWQSPNQVQGCLLSIRSVDNFWEVGGGGDLASRIEFVAHNESQFIYLDTSKLWFLYVTLLITWKLFFPLLFFMTPLAYTLVYDWFQ